MIKPGITILQNSEFGFSILVHNEGVPMTGLSVIPNEYFKFKTKQGEIIYPYLINEAKGVYDFVFLEEDMKKSILFTLNDNVILNLK